MRAELEKVLTSEKIKADTLRKVSEFPDQDYWSGYRIGLVGPSRNHKAILTGIGSPDLGRDARGRGYRDGLAFKMHLEEL